MPIDYGMALGNFGVKYTITWRGKKYPVQFLTDASRQAFEQWAKRQALASLRTARDEGLSAEQEYEADRSRVLREVHAGLYAFWSPNTLRWLAGDNTGGLEQLFLILAREADPALSDADIEAMAAEEPDQVRDVVDLIQAEVVAAAKKKGLLPKDWQPPKANGAAARPTSPTSTPSSSSPPSAAASASTGAPPPS